MTNTLPLLETSRLLLRAVRDTDLPSIQEHWNEPLVRRFLFDDKPVDQAMAAGILKACLEAAPEGHGMWLLIEKSSQQFIGCLALMPTSVAAEYEMQIKGLLELTVSITPEHWGRGLATDGLAAVLRYAFNTLSLPLVAAVNDVPNAASEKMLLKAGFSALSEVSGPKYTLRTYNLKRDVWLQRNDA